MSSKVLSSKSKAVLSKAVGFEKLEERQLFATVPTGFVDTRIASGLSTPTSLDAAPDGRIFISEQAGAIKIVKNGTLLSTPFAQINVNAEVEQGLLGMELDPNFSSNGYVYLFYNTPIDDPAGSHNKISRITANGDKMVPGSEVTLLDMVDTPSAKWHNGGAMEFGIDGKLYVAVGDHQSGSSAQKLSSMRGKILRLNTDPSNPIPTDNPFYNQTTGNERAIYALGMRNPYSMGIQPGTGRIYANDVGNQTWEEIDEIVAGGNYGWSTAEGDVNDPRFIDPVYTYQHGVSGGGECTIGGAFYTGVAQQFPAQYKDQYFFADFSRSWIKTINPTTHAVTNFATGAKNPTGIIATPDGSIWYLSRNVGAGTEAGAVGSLNRITYSNATSQAPVITDQPENQKVRAGDAATFMVTASGTGTLSYQWQRNNVNIPGATSATYSLLTTTMSDDNATFRCVVTNASGSTPSNAATLDVISGNAPSASIVTPVAGSTYGGGQQISFSGTGSDVEDGALAGGASTWWVDFHHDTHFHPFVSPTAGSKSGTFTIPTTGETSANVWYRVHLTVTDSDGLTSSTFRDIIPRESTLTFQTTPAGLSINLDGTPHGGGYSVLGVAGIDRLLEAPHSQVINGVPYEFVGWSDGNTSESRTYKFPEADTTLVANYQPATNLYLSDMPTKGTPINGKGQMERDMSNGGSAAGDGKQITLAGVKYTKGLGVWSKSDVSYDLNKRFKTFISDIGVDDAVGDSGTVIFKVYLDGTKVYDSGTRKGSSSTKSLNIDVTGKSTLRLVVENADGSSSNDSADWAGARLVAVDAGTAPAKPSIASAKAISTSQIDLSWTDTGTLATAYRIERSTDGENFSYIGQAISSARSFSDKGLAAGTSYYYRVYALNGALMSDPEEAATTTLAATTVGPVTLEAENAAISGGVVSTEKGGYKGTGYVDVNLDSGAYVEWNYKAANAASLPLAFRYSLKSGTRSMLLTINGVDVTNVSFAQTGSWSTWMTKTLNASLQAGNNVIRLTTTGTGGPNIDRLTVG